MTHATQNRHRLYRSCRAASVVLGVLGSCAVAGAFAATQTLAPSDDTFINFRRPDNNSGGSSSIFTGTDGSNMNGNMRGVIRFGMPMGLAGRATVSGVEFKMTTRAVGSGDSGTAATVSLSPITEPWIQGNGVGEVPHQLTIGEPCGGVVTGATWNQSNCTTAANWTSAGATISGVVSGSASVPAAIDTEVTWNSPGLSVDVQNWIDASDSNHGWRISSSTEGAGLPLVQRFYSSAAGVSSPSLAITYACKAGYFAAGIDCTTCTAAANGNSQRTRA